MREASFEGCARRGGVCDCAGRTCPLDRDEGYAVARMRVEVVGDEVRIGPAASDGSWAGPQTPLGPNEAVSLGIALIGRGEEIYRRIAKDVTREAGF